MQEQTKKPLEIAVIFKSKRDKSGVYIYKPVDIVLGHYDEENNLFYKKNGDNYHFLSEADEYLYTFGLRASIKSLNLAREGVPLKDYVSNYLKLLKEYTYDFQMQEDDYNTFALMATHKKTKEKYAIQDEEINKLKKQIIQASKINFDTKNLSDGIKSEVIGQDEAIDDIVTIIWQNLRSDKSKSNILLVGSTGVGKTEIIRNISKRLDIPMITMNATNLSPSAYKGASIDDSLVSLLKKANYDVKKASRGIIFIDEIDKKASTNNESNDGIITTNVQDELLKLLEDGDYQVNISDDILNPKMVTLNTKHITFICSGAFTSIKEQTKEVKQQKITGFQPISSTTSPSDIKIKKTNKITHNDLIKYGFKNELVGRLNNIIELNNLSKENLISIMKNPNNKTIQDKISILDSVGVKTSIDEEVYELLADNALQSKTGARGLVSVVDNLFGKAMQEISRNQNAYSELIITKDTIIDQNHYTLIKKRKKEGNN